ncbi:hypothetical protein [Carboxylicivirga marina]|uniref:hypothetical protein n=1 Tax=Carboxylicivirga marina TaxID=2800988 RepID=UPI0025939278|nr:hypothetical protein [uncultured Carboxylicivirga sp.]
MKRQLANYFFIVLHEKVESVNGNEIKFTSGDDLDFILTENNLDLTEKQSAAGANDYYSQNCQATTLSVSEEIRKKYRNSKVVVQFKTTQGDVITLGSKEVPVRCKVNSRLNTDHWSFTRSNPTPVIT